MISTVQRKIAQAGSQIRHVFLGLVARGGAKTLQLKGFSDEVLQDTELFQHVGFASHIPTEAKAVIIPLQGKTSKSIVIATSGGLINVDLSDGETCVYDQFGHSLLLKADGTHVRGGDLIVDDGNLKVNGKITGNQVQSLNDIIDKSGSMQEMRNAYNSHTNGNTPTPTPQM